MHFLYIIYSPKTDKFYVGETTNVEQRLALHNQHSFKKAFTTSAKNWVIKLSFECKSREEALDLERFIKRMKSKVFIQKIIKDPNILKDILNKK
jgi:putative endonuclease